ncbi:MAG: hypothetical protein IIZ83_05900 [Oscillospiraceae bacterium]|nr:hypothetical protein [Oscillospiraceae bacterium]
MDENTSLPPVGRERIEELTRILQRYKTGKANLERRVVAAENWWKLRNSAEERKESSLGDGGFRSKSGWLHNVIVSKHADAMDAFPEPVVLPREPDDSGEANALSSILPVVLAQNRFEDVYSDAIWQKLKTGTGVYKVTWDADKLGGLGDVAIHAVDLLNLFWEPGVKDIQESRYLFHTALRDNDLLLERWPQLRGALKANSFAATRFLYDDAVPTDGKSTVIDCYYKMWEGGRQVLHYVQYVGDTLLYSSENEGTPLYEHGRYPFVFDALFPVEGSPCGYGFVDLCKNAQTAIDLMDSAFIRNTMVGAMPRYFKRQDAGVNEEELLDLSRPLVAVDGNLGDDALKIIDFRPLSGNYIEYQRERIRELRETSGNTETSTGNIAQGVTAAAAIAALQEASGKGSRDSAKTSYRAYGEIVELVIELIRQFYTLPRRFRILGKDGAQEFISYSNVALRPRSQGTLAGVELGLRAPQFDIEVKARKASSYTQLSQNELALQFFNLGFFDPRQADQTLLCLEMMDFDGKEALIGRIRRLAGEREKLLAFRELALTLAKKYDPALADGLESAAAEQDAPARRGDTPKLSSPPAASGSAQASRAHAMAASQPGRVR